MRILKEKEIYNNIKALLDLQDKKINQLSPKFEDIFTHQTLILEKFDKSNKQLQSFLNKRRLKSIFYLSFSVIFVYYFSVWEFVINLNHYFQYFIDLFNQVGSNLQSSYIILNNVQQILENQELIKESNKQILENQEFILHHMQKQQLMTPNMENIKNNLPKIEQQVVNTSLTSSYLRIPTISLKSFYLW